LKSSYDGSTCDITVPSVDVGRLGCFEEYDNVVKGVTPSESFPRPGKEGLFVQAWMLCVAEEYDNVVKGRGVMFVRKKE
jgi:hypothetical protein